METNDETNNANEHNMVNPNWQEANQLVFYKRGRGVKLWSTKKQLQLSGQSGTRPKLSAGLKLLQITEIKAYALV